MIRVFPRQTKWTPVDRLSFIGNPPWFDLPPPQPVRISVTFTWDMPEAERLRVEWLRCFDDVEVGGPAYGDTGGDFTPGQYLRDDIGVTFTSRGCNRECSHCFVPKTEGKLRELEHIHNGWVVQDNNLFGCSDGHLDRVFTMLSRQPEPVCFKGGVDARCFNESHVERIQEIRAESLYFAYDEVDQLDHLIRCAGLMYGKIPSSKWRVYVMVGHKGDTFEAAEDRCMTMLRLGYLPYAMLYIDETGKKPEPAEWSRFQRGWVLPAIYRRKLNG